MELAFSKRLLCALFGFLVAVTIMVYVIYDSGNSIRTLRTYLPLTNTFSASYEAQAQSTPTAGIVKSSGRTGVTMVVETTSERTTTTTQTSSSSTSATSTTVKPVSPIVIFDRTTGTLENVVWTHMSTGRGSVDIMVYPQHLDVHISASLIMYGQWEPNEMLAMERLFQCDPELGLIDIGANIGVYVLLAAKYGRYSVGVEPSLDNISRLLKSVERNQFGNSVTLVRNAVSDRYTVLQLSANPVNRGNTVIRSDNNASLHVMGQDELKLEDRLPVGEVSTVLMDDLVPLVKFKRGILKIDIEGSEVLAFTHSSQFLSMIDVHYIFMEWEWIAKDPNGAAQKIYTLFVSLAFVPYSDPFFATKLNVNYMNWPIDVFWMKGEVCK